MVQTHKTNKINFTKFFFTFNNKRYLIIRKLSPVRIKLKKLTDKLHLNKSVNIFKIRVKIIHLFLLLFIMGTLIILGSIIKYNNERSKIVSVKIIGIDTMHSRGVRDDEKFISNKFHTGEPIQLRFNFEADEENSIINYELKRDGTEISKLELSLTGKGERYITIFPASYKLEPGKYEISIKQGKYKIGGSSFSIEDTENKSIKVTPVATENK